MSTYITKVCYGYDSHKFCALSDNKPLILGGCVISGHPGLQGVSDADVVIHAIVDAILSGVLRKSIGDIYHEDDPDNSRRNSMDFLYDCRDLLSRNSIAIVNVDCVVICDRPRISGYAEQMCFNLAKALDIDQERIFIKGKTTEGVSGIDGIICHTIVGFCEA